MYSWELGHFPAAVKCTKRKYIEVCTNTIDIPCESIVVWLLMFDCLRVRCRHIHAAYVLKRRLHIQFVQRFGFLFGSNIVPFFKVPREVWGRIACGRHCPDRELRRDYLDHACASRLSLYEAKYLGQIFSQFFCFIEGQYLAQIKLQIV